MKAAVEVAIQWSLKSQTENWVYNNTASFEHTVRCYIVIA